MVNTLWSNPVFTGVAGTVISGAVIAFSAFVYKKVKKSVRMPKEALIAVAALKDAGEKRIVALEKSHEDMHQALTLLVKHTSDQSAVLSDLAYKSGTCTDCPAASLDDDERFVNHRRELEKSQKDILDWLHQKV